MISPGLFATLGVKLAMGREFVPQEDIPGGDVNKAILSHALWEKRFNRDPAILGRVIRTSLGSFAVVGVASPGFLFPQDSALWIPIESELRARNESRQLRFYRKYRVVARLRDGVSLQAGAGRSPPDRHASSARLCRHQPRHPARSRAAAHGRNFRHAALRAAADGRSGIGAAGLLHEPGESAAGAVVRPRARVRGPRGDGRRAKTSPDPAPDREFLAGDRGRLSGRGAGGRCCSARCLESFPPSFPSGSTSIWTGTCSCSLAR